jgi:hypothetical protein
MVVALLKCSSCNEEKELQEFNRSFTIKRGYSYLCRKCDKHIKNLDRKNDGFYERKWQTQKKNIDRSKLWYRTGKRLHYKNTYGLTLDKFNEMRAAQGFKCAICGINESEVKGRKGKILSVDHCHMTNKVRGLLCNNCNLGLGNFKDNINSLIKAVKYLGG